MPSLRDFSTALHHVGPAELGKRVYAEVNKDNVFTNAAAMAYAWVFAVFPLMIFLMSMVPYLPENLRRATPDYVDKVMYGAGLQYAIVGPVKDTLTPLLNNTHKGLLSFSLVLTLYAASGGMNTTMSALDAALDVKKFRPFLLKRLVAIALTVFVGLAFLAVMLLLPIGTMAEHVVWHNVHKLPPQVRDLARGPLPWLLTLTRYLLGLVLIQLMIVVLYYVGPSRRKRLRLFTPGAIFTVVGWIATGWGLRIYFAHFDSYSKTYGAVAGMVIMLMVFYLDATIILIGAELDNEVEKARDEHPTRV